LVEPRDEDWAAFRQHYPVCDECSTEVARWSQLEEILGRTGPFEHPSEAVLLTFETDPGALPSEERGSVRLHLDDCAPCRDALVAVRSFDFESAIELTAAASTRAEKVARSWLERMFASLREAIGSLPQLRLSPVLVAVVLLLLAIPVSLAIWSVVGLRPPAASPSSAPGRLASDKAPLEAPSRAPGEQIAKALSGVSPSYDPSTPAPEKPAARAPATEAPERPAQQSAREPESPVAMVVASLIPESPLVYTPPRGFADAGLGRFAQGRRSAGSTSTPLALAPEHVGLTVRGSPTLYWFMPERADHRIEFVLAAPDAVEPVFILTTNAPIEPGFHTVPLGDHGVTIEPGVTYRWTVTLVLDEDQRYKDVIGGGAIARIHPSDALQAELEKAEPGAAGQAYAANGLWYDALNFVSQRIIEGAEEASARSRRAELLEQVGLMTAADYDRRATGAEQPGP
jgi:hypothetical protein